MAKPPDTPGSAPKAEPPESPVDMGRKPFPWTQAIPWAISFGLLLVAVGGFTFGFYQYRRRRADAAIRKTAELEAQANFHQAERRQASQTAEEQYRDILDRELGTVQVLGTHEIANVPVDLLETFVTLDLSLAWPADCAREPRM
ncbi:MAG: hypothetical protein FJ280_24090, partial [Planctomycetes bacterium]|nr:hypothetical protein [Planctomycetota bacterium]